MNFELTKEKELWESSVFVFDTSSLLDFYYYSDSTQKKIFSILKSQENKLWLPNHVFYEYNKHRKKKITDPKFRYDQLLVKSKNKDSGYIQKIKENLDSIKGILNTLQGETKNSDKHPFLKTSYIQKFSELIDKNQNEFEVFKKEITEEIKTQKKDIDDKIKNDFVFESINNLFEIGPEYSFETMFKISQEGSLRYSLEIPPGYMDAQGPNKKVGFQKFGDLFIWKQILEFAKDNKKSVILISNDVKEDWCISNENDKNSIKSPRMELLKEFKDSTQKEIWFYTTKQFLYNSNIYINSDVSQEILDEVDEYSINKNPVSEFLSFLGLDKGDEIDKVYNIFGEPTRHELNDESHPFNSVYYENEFGKIDFTYYKDSGRIYTIQIERKTLEFLADKNIYDPKLEYINTHISELQKTFGKTKKANHGNFDYDFNDENHRIKINFNCYDFHDELCSSFTVYWFR